VRLPVLRRVLKGKTTEETLGELTGEGEAAVMEFDGDSGSGDWSGRFIALIGVLG
jgi:hypothetical protein